MNWSNVKLILGREIRDQMRDRRTLFMIAVLPMLLYPLLGMSFFQMTQFVREHALRVLVVGAPDGPDYPPLVEDNRFAEALFHEPASAGQYDVLQQPPNSGDDALADARRLLVEGHFEVLVYFPPNFASEFERLQRSLVRSDERPGDDEVGMIPNVLLFPNLTKEASRPAQRRVADVLVRWRDQIAQRNLEQSHIPPAAARPFLVESSEEGPVTGPVWSKILPFVLLIWALTGAFYPAVDLCAGEKERGTLETLLCSPAQRIEIVWGKLLTIMLFSIATAVLNLISMGITGSLVLSRVPGLGPPPGLSMMWLLVALVPMSALFSALCLALAAFARSTKEGQYYLMPLVLITMPLTILPMAPGVELNLGYSLIPVTGVVLLLRAVLEGHYLATLPFVLPVVGVTAGCCWLAIRWATGQFNSESVLFRESERFDLWLWLKHLRRDRDALPTFGEAMFCGVVILVMRFFLGFAVPTTSSFRDFAVLAAITGLVVVAAPAIVMTLLVTRDPRRTLLLQRPPVAASLVALLLAVVLHPTANLLHTIVTTLYPLNENLVRALNEMVSQPDSLWTAVLALAVVPAVCEELAFRGFVLSGLRRGSSKWAAIGLSSVLFGAAHFVFQQSLTACVLGLVLGYIAVQTGSLLPCVLFHATHNSLGLVIVQLREGWAKEYPWVEWLLRDAAAEGPLYQWPVIWASLLASAGILAWFHRLPRMPVRIESTHEAVEPVTAEVGASA